jgi:2',3'-cyclic-nucleotide 2'-phosphodiesterase (5'-nucleotidase family)
MKKILLFLILSGAGLSACSTVSNYTVKTKSTRINDSILPDVAMETWLTPYRDTLQREMGIILAKAEGNFIKGLPEGALGNLVCDLVLEYGKFWLDSTKSEKLPLFCMFNNGGLRAPISQGNVTVGDVFKLMPFDNELVMVKMSAEKVKELVAFIVKVEGAPIGGARIENGKLYIDNKEYTEDLWIITSDYLAKGGDKYEFFKNPIRYIETNYLIRDCLLKQIALKKTLVPLLDQRIKLETK